MKRLQVLSTGTRKFNLRFSRVQMLGRKSALNRRIQELTQQATMARRSSDTQEADELDTYCQELKMQRQQVEQMLTTTNKVDQTALYQVFFSKHGEEDPAKP